jgi:hypothetical protein
MGASFRAHPCKPNRPDSDVGIGRRTLISDSDFRLAFPRSPLGVCAWRKPLHLHGTKSQALNVSSNARCTAMGDAVSSSSSVGDACASKRCPPCIVPSAKATPI